MVELGEDLELAIKARMKLAIEYCFRGVSGKHLGTACCVQCQANTCTWSRTNKLDLSTIDRLRPHLTKPQPRRTSVYIATAVSLRGQGEFLRKRHYRRTAAMNTSALLMSLIFWSNRHRT